MKYMDLLRVALRNDGTFGVLLDKGEDPMSVGEPFAVTCEEVWQNNQPQVSCIPAGVWLCKRVQSPKFGNTFEVTEVPGRSHILFHKGNNTNDTLGCILVAESYERIGGVLSVAQSGKGYDEFMIRLADTDKFMLSIREL